MQRYVNFIASTTSTSSTLMVLSNATCTVYVAGTSTAATLYSDNGITPLANPFLSSSTGQVAFYAANGTYDLVVSKIGYLTVTISAIELDDLLAPSGSNSVGYLPAGIGAVATTVQTKLRESVSVKDFGAVGDGTTDDTAAIQAAITAVKNTSKELFFPAGSYRVTSSLVMDAVGMSFIGAGGGGNARSSTGSAGVVGTGSNVSATQIIGDFNGGAVIRIKAQGCTVSDMTISRSATAYAASFAVTDAGVMVCPDDAVGYQTARKAYLLNLRVMNTNGDGILFANDFVNSMAENCEVNCVKGSGFMVAGGSYLSFTNRSQPGMVTLLNCTSCWTGGHGLRVGGGTAEVDGTDACYRVVAIQFEAFYNTIIAANCVSTPAIANLYLSGISHTLISCAFDGLAEFPSNAPATSSAVIRGVNIKLINHRMVQCTTPAAYVVAPAAGVAVYSRGVEITGLYVVNSSGGAGYFNPAVSIASAVRGVLVDCNQPDATSAAGIAVLTNRTVNTQWEERFNGANITAQTMQIAAGGTQNGMAQPDLITLLDDKAGYFQWDDITKGLVLIGGNTAAAQSGLLTFRVGTSGSLTSMSVTSNLNATTGQLTGTTGTDGKLTVSADTATNRLYIENRLGGTYSYTVTFLSCSTNSPGNGVLAAFVNL